jgi:hypothetical protein
LAVMDRCVGDPVVTVLQDVLESLYLFEKQEAKTSDLIMDSTRKLHGTFSDVPFKTK